MIIVLWPVLLAFFRLFLCLACHSHLSIVCNHTRASTPQSSSVIINQSLVFIAPVDHSLLFNAPSLSFLSLCSVYCCHASFFLLLFMKSVFVFIFKSLCLPFWVHTTYFDSLWSLLFLIIFSNLF